METGKDGYTSYRIDVSPEFEQVFSHFYIAGNLTSTDVRKTLVPSFQTMLAFSFGTGILLESDLDTKIEIDKCIILGPVKQPIHYVLPIGSELLVANFRSDAFFRFFGQSLASGHLLTHPDDLLEENCFTELWFVLKDIDSANDRVNFLLEFCRPYLKKRNADLETLAGFSDESNVFSSIKSMARETNQSERNIQLHHKKYFGYSAKEVARYQRFLKAFELLQQKATNIDWFEIIDRCGYYDQSQLIHDFKHYLNLSPTKFLKFQQDICSSTPA